MLNAIQEHKRCNRLNNNLVIISWGNTIPFSHSKSKAVGVFDSLLYNITKQQKLFGRNVELFN